MTDTTTFDTIGDEPVEARIVAWVLGEASAFEAAELERLCEERPELLIFRRRMRALHGLLTEAEAAESDEEWKLPAMKRKGLDEILGTASSVVEFHREKSIRHTARRAFLAIAACLILTAIMGGLFSPAVMRQRKRADASVQRSVDFMPSNGDGGESIATSEELPVVGRLFKEKETNEDQRGMELGTEARTKGVIHKSIAAVEGQKKKNAELQPSTPSQPAAEDLAYNVESATSRKPSAGESAKQRQLAQMNESAPALEALEPPAALPELPQSLVASPPPQRNAGSSRGGLSGGFGGGGSAVGFGMAKDAPPVVAAPSAAPMPKGQVALGDESKPTDSPSPAKPMDFAGKLTDEYAAGNVGETVILNGGTVASGKTVGEKASKASKDDLSPPPPVLAARRSTTAQPDGKPLSGSNTYTGSTTVSGGTLNGPISSLEKKEVAAPQEAMDSRARKDDGEKAAADDFGQMSTLSSLSGDKGSGKGFGKGNGNGAGTPEGDMERLGRDKGIAGGRTGSDFISPVDGTTVDGIPADPDQFTSNGVTNGLRSGDQAITRTNIDAILNNPNRTAESAAGERAALLKDGDSSGDLGVYYNKENKGMKDAPVAAPPVLAAKKPAPSENTPLPATAPAPGSFSDSLYSDADMLKSGAEAQRELESADLAFRAARGSAVEGLDRSKSDQSDENGKDIPVLGALFKQRQALNEEVVAGDPKNAAASDSTRAELMKSVEAAWALPVPFPATGGFQRDLSFGYHSRNGDKESSLNEWDELHRKPDVDFDGVINYGEPIRNTPIPALVDLMDEIPASENPYSTFSLNINDASFQTAKAALDKGERPDPESIKPEQFYNAVDYGDPAPTADQAVAATIEQSAHPVIPGRSLVRVALRVGATGHSKAQPLRLTLLVDQSGSMVREDRRAAMEQALAQLGGLLTKDDVISVVGFSRLPRLLADGMTGDQAGKLGDLVNQTASEGGTNLEEAMKVGEQLALRHQVAGAQNRIVLFTDGAANLGNADPEKLAAEVKVLRQKGIAFDIAGIGADGLNDRLLGELARHGNGRYYVVSDTKDAHFAQQLAGAFRPAAENVKVQVNFNPQRVGKYKLLGFEKDRLKTEDFRNDAVDAAELAAEEAGVAIYQVETLPEGSGEIGEVSVRFRDAASGDMVERSWTIPNESSVSAFDRATPSMQLAGLSLLAAEKLRGGPLGDAIDFNQFAGPRALVKQVYGCSTRVADMLRVIDALK